MADACRQRVLIFGNRELACRILYFLYEQRAEISIVPNQNDPGYDTLEGFSLINAARQLSIKNIIPTSASANDLDQSILTFNPDFALSCSYDRIVHSKTISILKYKIYNFHFSLLPRHRGCMPIVWGIASGDVKIGVSFHQLTEGLDAGPIILQEELLVIPGMTAANAYHKSVQIAFQMFTSAYQDLRKGLLLKGIAQNEESASSHRLVFPFSRWIPWHLPAKGVARIINSLTNYPFPAPRTYLNSEEVNLYGPSNYLEDITMQPGEYSFEGKQLIVGCGYGVVTVSEMKTESLHGAPYDILPRNGIFISPVVPEENNI